MTCCDSTGSDDGLGFVLEMVRLLLLRPDFIVCEYVEKNVFLTNVLFASGNLFFGFDDLPTESLKSISTLPAAFGEGGGPAGIQEEPSSEAGLL